MRGILCMYMYGARFSAQPFLSKMRALEIGRAKRNSNDGKIKKRNRQYVTNETSRYKSHFVYNILVGGSARVKTVETCSSVLYHDAQLVNSQLSDPETEHCQIT